MFRRSLFFELQKIIDLKESDKTNFLLSFIKTSPEFTYISLASSIEEFLLFDIELICCEVEYIFLTDVISFVEVFRSLSPFL